MSVDQLLVPNHFNLYCNTITAAESGTSDIIITTDSGSATGTTIAFNALNIAGGSVSFSGAGSTVQLHATDVHNNTFVGLGAGNSTATGTSNSSYGVNALHGITSGVSNCAFGSGALDNITTSSQNCAFGINCLGDNSGGSNCGYGYGALLNSTTGSNNTSIGNLSGVNVVAGSNNIYLGANAAGGGDESNAMRLGNTGTTSAFISGVFGTSGTGNAVVCTSSGQIVAPACHRALKKDISALAGEDSHQTLMKLRPEKYKYIDDKDQNWVYGLIIDETSWNSDMMFYDKKGLPVGIDAAKVPMLLLAGYQRQSQQIEGLIEQIVKLKNQLKKV